MSEDDYQNLYGLSENSMLRLQAMVEGKNIQSIQLESEWFDDHIPCAGILFTTNEESYRLGLWWCGPEIIAAARYFSDSATAQKDMYQFLTTIIEGRIEENQSCEDWDSDEELSAIK